MRWWDIPDVMSLEGMAFGDTAWTAAQFWSELAHADRAYLVNVDGERISAYGGVMVRPPTADIQTIAVHPDCRGTGVGGDLLRRLLSIAEAGGCTEVLLEVRSDNVAAIALYTSHDFEVIARRTSYYGPGDDALIMRRRHS